MAIIDVITYAGEREAELFEIRYNILKDFVDEFRVIEFDKTFSGKPKEKKFNQHWDKVKYYFITEDIWGKYWEEAKKSPNTNYGQGAEHWLREWCQKESIRDCLTDINDEIIITIGDCDEIVDLGVITSAIDFPFKAKLRVYTYFLNNRSDEKFYGTLIAKYGQIKGRRLNHLRSFEAVKIDKYAGWHFTNVMNLDKIRDKLNDSYTEDSYATKQVLDNLEDNIKNNRDFLGRNFIFKKDESELPQWLLENKEKYKHLFLGP